jgi:hypothetical protein
MGSAIVCQPKASPTTKYCGFCREQISENYLQLLKVRLAKILPLYCFGIIKFFELWQVGHYGRMFNFQWADGRYNMWCITLWPGNLLRMGLGS